MKISTALLIIMVFMMIAVFVLEDHQVILLIVKKIVMMNVVEPQLLMLADYVMGMGPHAMMSAKISGVIMYVIAD